MEEDPQIEEKTKEVVNHNDMLQYYYIADETQKFIILYMIFKLKFFGGKSIIVCKTIEQSYKI